MKRSLVYARVKPDIKCDRRRNRAPKQNNSGIQDVLKGEGRPLPALGYGTSTYVEDKKQLVFISKQRSGLRMSALLNEV